MYTKFITIIMFAVDNYVMPKCVTATSAIINKNEDTYYEFNIIMAECSDFSREKIQELENVSSNCSVNIIKVSLEKYRNINQLEHISVAALLKFDMCDIVSQYDKILYIDGDILVQADLWELFSVDIGKTYAGAVKEISCVVEDRGIINSRVLLFNAKRIRDEHLSEKFLKKRIELGDRGSMDQQTFNLVFNRDYTYISIRYNCNAGKLIGDNKMMIIRLRELINYIKKNMTVFKVCWMKQ